MGQPQFASDKFYKMSPLSPHVQPEIFLKIKHSMVVLYTLFSHNVAQIIITLVIIKHFNIKKFILL